MVKPKCKIFDQADSISIVNWTMLKLTDVLKQLTNIFYLNCRRKIFLFDLADPEKRTDKDILRS